MIPNKLIEAAVAIVFAIASTGQLPKFIRAVQIAQYEVLKASQSSHWGKAFLPENQSKKMRKNQQNSSR